MADNRFDQEALAWDSKPETVQSSQACYEALLARIPELQKEEAGLAILDLGCGTGLLSQRLAQCPGVSKVVGVDTSEGMIKMWVCGGTKTPRCTSLTSLHRFNSKQAKVPGGEKMVGHVKLLVDPNDAILQGQKFDIAVTHLALHHIEDMAPVVHTLAGTLSAGGRVFLSDFENDGEHAVRFHPKSKHHDVERHGVTREEMLEILQSANLNDVKVENSFALDKTIQETGEQEPFPFLLGQGSK